MTNRAVAALLVIAGVVAVALTVVLALVLTDDNDGDSRDELGALACELYRDEQPGTADEIAVFRERVQVQLLLDAGSTPTRQAFSALIASPGADAAAEVRAVCLAEHGVEIAG